MVGNPTGLQVLSTRKLLEFFPGVRLESSQLMFLSLSLSFLNNQQLDQVTRQRSLSSLELFLSCAQKQLSALIATEPVDIE
jgi:hypothetical protein